MCLLSGFVRVLQARVLSNTSSDLPDIYHQYAIEKISSFTQFIHLYILEPLNLIYVVITNRALTDVCIHILIQLLAVGHL